MQAPSMSILLLSDPADPLHAPLCAALAARGSVRHVGADVSDEELGRQALGCTAIVALGDGWATRGALLGAAGLPGVRRLLLVVRGVPDLTALRRKGVPYTVIRPAPLTEDLLAALRPALDRGRLHLARGSDPQLALLSRQDLGAYVAWALTEPHCCGRFLEPAAPGRPRLSEVAMRAAAAAGRPLKVSEVPGWAARALSVLSWRPFQIPAELVRQVPEPEELDFPGPWQDLADLVSAPSAAVGAG
ncbi:MAG: hypothetical protein RMK29_14825 [Myxococcales bacterium]|nr:hypothetical protein [Myxococcales bacterium]